MTPATLAATLSWRSKTSSSDPSKRSAQRLGAAERVDQLCGDAHPTACFAHRSFEDIANAQFAPDLLHVDGLAFAGEARIAGDDEEPADTGECRDDLLDHSVGEIFLLRVAAHVLEWQHRDRRLVGEGQRRHHRGGYWR